MAAISQSQTVNTDSSMSAIGQSQTVNTDSSMAAIGQLQTLNTDSSMADIGQLQALNTDGNMAAIGHLQAVNTPDNITWNSDGLQELLAIDDVFDERLDKTFQYEVLDVWLHRGHVLEELENLFLVHDFDAKGTSMHVHMILPNGTAEEAEDTGGVLRDALSEYWESFYMQRTVGNIVKVPALAHYMDGGRWRAVAKIILAGYHLEKYLPVQISNCFLEYAVHGDSIPKEALLQEFLMYLGESDRQVAKSCLENFESVDEEELFDFLEDHKVKVKATPESIRTILEEIAHKELIQDPTYVAD
jgi:hypothetical protein